jgi:putative ABC transport system ATP-binding protein
MRTIVFVTHEADIAKFATRNVIFRDGRIQRESIVTDRLSAKDMLRNLPVEISDEIE